MSRPTVAVKVCKLHRNHCGWITLYGELVLYSTHQAISKHWAGKHGALLSLCFAKGSAAKMLSGLYGIFISALPFYSFLYSRIAW